MADEYVFGYGSLIERESRTRTNSEAVYAYPAIVTGISRGWYHRPTARIGFTTTVLGAKCSKNACCNGVVFGVEDIAKTDRREVGYNRKKLSPESIQMLDRASVPEGEIYVYVSKKVNIQPATPQYPIIQSYVDICLNGCLEIESEYRLAKQNEFARMFMENTTDWSEHWVNDRIYPRRPHIYVSKAREIDNLLNDWLPEYFRKIKIE